MNDKENAEMMKFRLTYTDSGGFDYLGFDSEREAMLWAAHQERLGLIKAQKLLEYNKVEDTYKEVKDLSAQVVEIGLPYEDQNKQYLLTYVQNKIYHEIIVEAPAPKTAERYFLSKKPIARSLSAREAYPGDMKPGIPVLVLTKREERILRDDFLASHLEELDLSVRTYNALRRSGIETIRHLVCKSEAELREFRNMGDKSFEEIITILSAHGESLAPDSEYTPKRKPTLSAQIRSVAYYAEKKEVWDAVLESDNLRNMTLDACYAIPGYKQLPREDKNKLYDLVKKSISLTLTPDKDQKSETLAANLR